MIILDTHVVVWLAFQSDRLSSAARKAIDRSRANADPLGICDISLWEITVLVEKGRVRMDTTLESFLREVESRFVVLPVTARICARAITLPGAYPKDPADRLIGATALVQGLPLITADTAIRRAATVQTIW